MKLTINNELNDSMLEFIAYDVIKDLGLNKSDLTIHLELNNLDNSITLGYVSFYDYPLLNCELAETFRRLTDSKALYVNISFNLERVKNGLKGKDLMINTIAHEFRHVFQIVHGKYEPENRNLDLLYVNHMNEIDADKYAERYMINLRRVA